MYPIIERRVAGILDRFCVREAPVKVERIAIQLGIRLEPQLLGDDVSGLLVIKENKAVISYHSKHPLVRRRFTIAHEIGHFVLHRTDAQLFIDNNTYGVVMARDAKSSTGEDKRERQANAFAAALLMPAKLINQAVEDKYLHLDLADSSALTDLAKHFQVSPLAMTYRLINLGHISSTRML